MLLYFQKVLMVLNISQVLEEKEMIKYLKDIYAKKQNHKKSLSIYTLYIKTILMVKTYMT